jgi:HD-like signal output (HDOD) protein
MIVDEEKALAQLVASGVRIPPQPKVVIELQELLMTGDYDLRSVAKIIGQDPGIVSMLFKAAKSPVFKRSRELTSLDQILMTIGVKQTFNLVQAIALSTAVSDGTRKAFDVFWIRAQEIGRIAALIAGDRVSVCNVFPDQAFMAGIFHECGVPVLMMRFPKYCEALQLQDACCWPSLSEEDARFSVDHVTVGYLVARHWKLPDFVCAAIRYHHELPSEELGAAISLVSILQLAIQFYHRLNRQENPVWKDIGLRVLAEIGISPDDESDYFDQISHLFLEGES